MGGNTAIQSLTVVTRGLATGDYKFTTYLKSIIKETSTGLTIGLITGVMAGFLTYFWKGDQMVSVVICLSMVINSLFSSFMGAITPMVLTKLGKDPALGSGVIVTMATDIFSFFSFLGIASLGLKYFT
jgi:magnesium transporter